MKRNRINTLIGMLAAMLAPMTASAAGNGQYWTDTHFTSGQFMYEIIQDDGNDVARLVEPVSDAAEGMTDAVVPAYVEYGGKSYPVTRIADHVFSNMAALRSVTLPASVWDMKYNFMDCPALEQVIMPEGMTGPFHELFVNCPAMKSQPFPSSIGDVGNAVLVNCGLTELVVEDEVYFGMDCVCNMPELVTITFSGTSGFGENSFCNLPLLKKIDLTAIGTSVIHSGVFNICPALEELYLPASNELMIFDNAFLGCPKLKAVYCPQAVPPVVKKHNPVTDTAAEFGGNTGDDGAIDKEKCVLYVPVGAADAYRAAPQWNTFTNIVEYDFASAETISQDLTDNAEGPAEYFDFSGRRISSPAKGVCIIRKGNRCEKVIIR